MIVLNQALAQMCSPASERPKNGPSERATREVTLALSLRKMAFWILVASSSVPQ